VVSIHCNAVAVAATSILVVAGAAFASDAPTSARINEYPAAFFASAQPYSAFDMLTLLPGYTFSEADSDVRGFAGSAGNVLIDGERPASKRESLETILRRIPAGAVSRIELLRAGANGVDMQGHTVLANVVRADEAESRGSMELASAFYERGLKAPRVAGEFSRRSDERLLEIAAARYRTVDDEHGAGSRPRVAPDGTSILDSSYRQDEGKRASELAAGYEQRLGIGKLRINGSYRAEDFHADIREDRTFPVLESSTAVELDEETEAELGLRYERPLGAQLQLELMGITRGSRERETERKDEAESSSLFEQISDDRESIVRGALRRAGEEWTVEGGLEGALNTLDSRSQLFENGFAVALPAADVRVEEQRTEAFANATWRMSAAWTFEAGSRFESSRLTQSGDSNLRKSFSFAKPRALVSFAATPATQWRLLVERRIGQLDFGDFVSSSSLAANTVTAGNPQLEPDRTWLAELAWEYHFLGSGSLVLTGRREQITALIDRLPVGEVEPLDAVGNIGDGQREELAVSLTLPLHPIGLQSARLKASALWRSSRATDPTTGGIRAISDDEPFEAELHFTHDLPQRNVHWGIDVRFEHESTEFMIDEIRTDRVETLVNVFAEYEPRPAWKLRLFVNNLTDRAAVRERRIYEGLRGSAPLECIETRSLQIGRYAGFSVRRSFGG
jgi:TonB dependent receptor